MTAFHVRESSTPPTAGSSRAIGVETALTLTQRDMEAEFAYLLIQDIIMDDI
jgi:hypothetical protein